MGSPLQQRVVLGFTAVHLGAIVATLWVLMLNGIVGFQLIDDGTPISLGLILLSAAALFIGAGYIALDTAFKYSGHFNSSMDEPNRNIGLYVLYQLAPLVFLVGFFILETILVLNVLGEKKPMRTNGKINGALFQSLFTLLAVVMTWVFWSSITEDDWPMPVAGGTYT
ncbi:MAG: hypothetical protein Q9212_004834 [Teloschistes hypoglaucus]